MFQKLFRENSAIMLLIDTANGGIVDANTAAEIFYGYTAEEFRNLHISDINILPKEEIEKQIAYIHMGDISIARYRHRLKDGSIRYVKVLASPVNYEDRHLNFAIIHDINDEVLREEEENKFKSIAENSPAYIGMANMNREVIYMNREMRREFGIAPDSDLSGYRIFDFYSTKGKQLAHSLIGKIESVGFWKGENEMQTPSGKLIPVMQTIVIIKDGNGNPLFTSSTAINISKEKEAEAQIIESENSLREGEQIGKFGYWKYHVDKQEYDFSEGAKKIYGLENNRICREDIIRLRVPEYGKMLDEAFLELITAKEPVQVNYQIRRKNDGQIADIHVVAKFDPDKNIVFGSIKDITEQKKRELEIVKLSNELRTLNGYLQSVRNKERARFASEVHDKIGQKLVALRLIVERIRKHVGFEPAGSTIYELEEMIKMIREMTLDFREIYSGFKPSLLMHLNLSDAIKELGVFFTGKGGCPVALYSNTTGEGFTDNIRNTFLQVTEIYLSNILEHGHPSEISVRLLQEEGFLTLQIEDNEKDTDKEPHTDTIPRLLEARELVKMLGGEFSIHRNDGSGTIAEIIVPV